MRSEALARYGLAAGPRNEVKHYKDRELSPEAKEKIKSILMEERKKARREKGKRGSYYYQRYCRDSGLDKCWKVN